MRSEARPDYLRVINGGKKETPGPKIETPESIEAMGAVSNEAIARTLEQKGLTFEGKREILSGGFFGPIHLLEAKTPEGESIKVVEKVFSATRKAPGKRYAVYRTDFPMFQKNDTKVRSRLEVVGSEGETEAYIVDWLFNEEDALRQLDGIDGIPKTYGAVYEGTEGSILEEFIDGYDLSFCDEEGGPDLINDAFDRVEKTYKEAAERGYVLRTPQGATIMVDRATNQPYLIDWYNHVKGSVESEGPVRQAYLEGLEQLAQRRRMMLESYFYRQQEKTAE